MNKTTKKHPKQKKDFIDDEKIWAEIKKHRHPSAAEVRRIIQKSLKIKTLQPKEVAVLLNVQNKKLWQEMRRAGRVIKKKVYDNRIVTFAPLYCSNYCINNYCASIS